MNLELSSYTRYLHDNIPLTAAMGITVIFYDGHRAVLRAPFAPNINHRHTIFGGSIANLGILAGWFVLHERLTSEESRARLVIQKSTVDYLLPGVGEFWSECSLAEEEFVSFRKMLQRHGKARMTLSADILAEEKVIAVHRGIYVGLSY